MNAALAARIQPCLLDRLTDRNPSQSRDVEGSYQMPLEEYRKSVARDLRWLLSTGAPPEVQPKDGLAAPADYYLDPAGYTQNLTDSTAETQSTWVDLRRFPRVARSVIAYGLRQVVCRPGPSNEQFRREILRVLLDFEPRIVAETVAITLTEERQSLHCLISGKLLTFPVAKDFEMQARVDRESGEIRVS